MALARRASGFAGEEAALAMELDGRATGKKSRPRRQRDAGLAREIGEKVSSARGKSSAGARCRDAQPNTRA